MAPSRVRRAAISASRGQALVEFAIILPVLALLLVITVDFGRVFFGWVGLHNAARIAANEAALHPEAWAGAGNADLQDKYRETVVHDLQALNCNRSSDGQPWTASDVPSPTFEDKPATSFSSASSYEVGDHAVVTIACSLDVLTPLAGFIIGDPLLISATSEFPVRGGKINGIPIGPAPPAPPPPGCSDAVVPNLRWMAVQDARIAWENAGFSAAGGSFNPETGSDTDLVDSQTTTPLSSTPGDCLPNTTSVLVAHTPPLPCSGSELRVPNVVGLTVNQARSAWSATGFTGAFAPAIGSDADHVTGQTTVPSSDPGDCRPPDTTVTVTHVPPPPDQCPMPQLIGMMVNAGEAAFRADGFTGAYDITRPPSGNYDITSQSLVGGQRYDCVSSVTVAGN